MIGPLHLSPSVTLPVDTITDTVGIFGTRGGGKTSTAVVIVEEAHHLGLPVVIIDVKGDWWGLRSSASSTGEGLPFAIFGGEHGDVPLEPTAGEVLADLIVDERPDAILDLSDMSKTKQRTFATAFAERLYRRNREALLVVVDEADVLIPQRATNETARLVGAWDDVAKRGRGRGLGMLVVTQRPQDVAKSVLDEMHTLVLHGVIGPRAIGAIKLWIADHDDVEGSRTKEVLQSLRSLDPGEGWVWAPQHDMLVRTRVRRIRTFDSHATPEPGKARRQPKARASIDLDRIRDQIAATVERAEANDPAALKRKVADLSKRLAAAEAALTKVETETVEVPVVTAEMRDALMEIETRLRETAAQLTEQVEQAVKAANKVGTAVGQAFSEAVERRTPPARIAAKAKIRREDLQHSNPDPVRNAIARQAAQANGDTLSKAERGILTVLVTRGGQESVANIATLTGYSAKGGGFRNALGSLRTKGHVVGKGDLTITDVGEATLGPVDPLPTGAALREHWKGHPSLGKAHALIIDSLAEHWPEAMTIDDVAEETGYAATGGGFRNAIGRLRSLGLAHTSTPGTLRIDERLMEEA